MPEHMSEHVDVVKLLSTPSFLKSKKIEVIETAISWIFLNDRYVYKLKKPINLGFLDYTTLEKRKHFCEREIELNSRLSPQIYLGVDKVTKTGLNKNGEILDYVVKMVRLPKSQLMSNMLKDNNVKETDIVRIAIVLADFHRDAELNYKFGDIEIIKENWTENFDQTKQYIGTAIDSTSFYKISDYVNNFIEKNISLFADRIAEEKIRRCHGDMHSENIFIIEDNIFIFDCIEFNDRFSCGDVASEVAFLCMDLDFHDREDLSELFAEKYIKFSQDNKLRELLLFYKIYRAYVRGKIACFSNDFDKARMYFDLCLKDIQK